MADDWEVILRADGPAIWQTARRLVGNDADADECFQDAFVDALKMSGSQTVRHWRALLTRLVTVRAIDCLRRRRRRDGREDSTDWENVAQAGALPPEQAEAAELLYLLRNALVELPVKQAQIFCLACLDGWSHAAVAQQLGISVDAVGVSVHRARQRLRTLLASANEVNG